MYSQYSGIWDTLQSVISTVGINADTSAAMARAAASPTMANIREVEAAFKRAGTSAPPEVLDLLYKRYADSVARYPAAYGGGIAQAISDNWLYLLFGGLALWAVLKRR